MSNTDRMTLTVLEDGTAKVETDGISGANHVQAENLLAQFTKLMGGEAHDAKRKQAHGHRHQHGKVERGA